MTHSVHRLHSFDNLRAAKWLPVFICSAVGCEARVEGDTVILAGRLVQQMERDGQTRTMQMRYTDTYAKRQGRWQVIASQLTRIQTQ